MTGALLLAADAGYVAAAYGVFVALVVVYAAILAVRMRNARREVRELERRAAAAATDRAPERELEPAT